MGCEKRLEGFEDRPCGSVGDRLGCQFRTTREVADEKDVGVRISHRLRRLSIVHGPDPTRLSPVEDLVVRWFAPADHAPEASYDVGYGPAGDTGKDRPQRPDTQPRSYYPEAEDDGIPDSAVGLLDGAAEIRCLKTIQVPLLIPVPERRPVNPEISGGVIQCKTAHSGPSIESDTAFPESALMFTMGALPGHARFTYQLFLRRFFLAFFFTGSSSGKIPPSASSSRISAAFSST